MMQPDLFSATVEATNDGIQRADDHAAPDWKEDAYHAICRCALRFGEFTADEVWDILDGFSGASTHEPSALGPVFLRAARDGIIVNSGRRQKHSKFPRRHRELTIWESLVRS